MKEQNLQLRQLGALIWITFLLVALGVLYWGVWRGEALAERDDNPRVVESALRIQRGTIYDSHDRVLAMTLGPDNRVIREYPLGHIGPAVGYYSFRHGEAGIEAGFSGVLAGTDESDVDRLWREALHRPQVGRDIRLTLDSEWQLQAEALLADERGAVVMLSVPDGAIRVMASHPGFDPNLLDEQFEMLAADEHAPLLNRATQGLYQPGLVLQPLLYAAALEQGRLVLAEDVAHMSDPVILNDQILECEGDPAGLSSWAQSLIAHCPSPLLTLAAGWGPDELISILTTFGLMTLPDVPIAAESTELASIADMDRAVLGQGELTVSPLQMALAFGALANEGRLIRPQLVSSIRDAEGEWHLAFETFQTGLTAVSSVAAEKVLAVLPRHEGIIEHHVLALAGPDGSQNSWFLGLAPAGSPQLVVVVVIEDVENAAVAQEIGRSLLRGILFANDSE